MSSGLSASVERSLLDQARRNELRLARVRVAALGAAAILDTAFHLFPLQTIGAQSVPAANAILASFWFAVAVAITVALGRGWYSRPVRIALAALDPVIVLTLFLVIFESLRGTPKGVMHPVVVTGAACTLLAASGALRQSRAAAGLAGALAVATFAIVAAIVGYTLTEALFVCAIVACAGLLGIWMTENTRRAVAAEANRVILRRFLPERLAGGDTGAALALVSTPRSLVATVLVSDLRGFTAAVERLDPTAALDYLNEIQGALAECVRRNGGVVDKFMGDGMLAVFGAPEPLADHAACALRASAQMFEALERIARMDRPAPSIGIGVHTGELVAGCVGSGERLEFTVIGDTVNIASRLEALTKDLQVRILLSGDTKSACGGADGTAPALVPVGELRLRGRDATLQGFTFATQPARLHPQEP